MTQGPNPSDPPASKPRSTGRSVLLVDDDEALVEALTELLQEEGYCVEAHTVASDALARLREGVKPDVVLLDWMMPAMNGETFLIALDEAAIDVPVFLLSAMNESRMGSPRGRVRAVIRKPFDLERLLGELERLKAA